VHAPWRLLVTEPLEGSENMALDHALLRRARRTGECVLRTYGWSRPTVSVGRHQTTVGIYDRERAARLGIPVVRRPTGGRAVVHARDVTYSVTAPAAALGPAPYDAINALLLDALGRLGVVAALAPHGRAVRPAGDRAALPCFAAAAGGEIITSGRKLAGSAQWQHDGALLQHGSILVDDDQSLLASLAPDAGSGNGSTRGDAGTPDATADAGSPGSRSSGATTLRAALGRAPTVADVAEALAAAVRAHDPGAEPLVVDDALRRSAESLRAQYRDDGWTWRR